jgi:hypothetical protein
MTELEDYGGEFRPDAKLQDFSKDTILRLWRSSSLVYMMLGGLWFDVVKDKVGKEKALEWEREVWLKRGGCENDIRVSLDTLKITGDDVAALLKAFQFAPGEAGWIDIECELKNNNHGILTATRCPALDILELSGDDERRKHACEDICVPGMQLTAEYINPKMKCRALKLPPRASKDEIACQWEFKLEQ